MHKNIVSFYFCNQKMDMKRPIKKKTHFSSNLRSYFADSISALKNFFFLEFIRMLHSWRHKLCNKRYKNSNGQKLIDLWFFEIASFFQRKKPLLWQNYIYQPFNHVRLITAGLETCHWWYLTLTTLNLLLKIIKTFINKSFINKTFKWG